MLAIRNVPGEPPLNTITSVFDRQPPQNGVQFAVPRPLSGTLQTRFVNTPMRWRWRDVVEPESPPNAEPGWPTKSTRYVMSKNESTRKSPVASRVTVALPGPGSPNAVPGV